ncbi:hypothetical protein GCM10017608_14420 [Agromyces luteolus]|uniref:Uncharacterized protein n=1 Tax=Agromyces luteolus TaxID=88373 RepID=A0A7C9MI96_9MICO|nr:hypothetical protein [Agromyces luteolus]MUN07738.1 hypothetical protein [Agromyces luteolus]GLK27508.1 hypothetical protein GCM10017608_14420 [Agromyces luteolus]
MTEPIVDAGTQVRCPHGGIAAPLVAEARVRVDGLPAVTVATRWAMSGCRGEGPDGCVTAHGIGGSSRVSIGGVPVVRASDRFVGDPSGADLTVVVRGDRVRAG